MPDTKPARRLGWYSIVLHLALVGLSIQVVVLTQRAAQSQPIAKVEVGDSVSPIAVRDLDGVQQTLDFASSDRETLLLVFTTSCPACQDNIAGWMEVYERYRDRFDVIGLSVDEPEATLDYVVQNLLPYPVMITSDPEAFPRRYGIPGVPHTLRIGTDGTVRGVMGGILSEEQIATLAEPPVELAELSSTLRDR